MASSPRRPIAATPTSRVEDERYCLPPISSNSRDAEILMYLPPLLELYRSSGHTGVNAGVPWVNPWNIPGMPLDEEGANRREKYYVTDCSSLKSDSTNPATETGFWKPRDHGWGIPGQRIGPSGFAGLKKTYDFYVGETIHLEGSKGTSWIMDVYFLIDQTHGYHQIEDDLVICHVFKGNSKDYIPRPRCAAHHHESPKEKEIHAQSNNALLERPAGFLATHINSSKQLSPPDQAPQPQLGSGCVSHHQASKENVQPGSLAAHHHQGLQLPDHGCNQNTGEPNHQAISQNNDHFNMDFLKDIDLDSDMEGVTGYFGTMETDIGAFLSSSPNLANENAGGEISMEMSENDMPNGVVPSTVSSSAENGPLGKRARTKSSVWERFTKLFTKPKAKAVLAVCNHCYKVMTCDSSKGTSHLNRHKCHCNHSLSGWEMEQGTNNIMLGIPAYNNNNNNIAFCPKPVGVGLGIPAYNPGKATIETKRKS